MLQTYMGRTESHIPEAHEETFFSSPANAFDNDGDPQPRTASDAVFATLAFRTAKPLTVEPPRDKAVLSGKVWTR